MSHIAAIPDISNKIPLAVVSLLIYLVEEIHCRGGGGKSSRNRECWWPYRSGAKGSSVQTSFMFAGGKKITSRKPCKTIFFPRKADRKKAIISSNRFLHGLSGAVVLYHYFCSIEGIACGSTKYITQWHLVSLSSKRTKTKFPDKLHCPLVNFRNNWSFYSTKERFPRQNFRHWHCFTSRSTHKGRVWLREFQFRRFDGKLGLCMQITPSNVRRLWIIELATWLTFCASWFENILANSCQKIISHSLSIIFRPRCANKSLLLRSNIMKLTLRNLFDAFWLTQ